MREIKFRFWRDGKMQSAHQLNAYTNTGNNFSGDGEILMQYTGLKDKNGKEIYEGDFIEVMGVFYQIVWRGIGFWFMDTHTKELFVFDPQVYHLEVVGNIYESPELLEAVNNG